MEYTNYLREHMFPLFNCSGCGNGIVLRAMARAYAELEIPNADIVHVTGIGCWGKIEDYLETCTLHCTHGRTLGFSTGVVLANPKLTVVAIMGDGDGSTIGGNHLIHAARRNVNVTAILLNNLNYGMTGGQYSGTTPEDSITSTSRYGHVEPGFDICELVKAAGATYVAREIVDNPAALKKYIKEGIQNKGFSLIEAVSPCPTHYGKNNKMNNSVEMLKWMRSNSVSVNQAKNMSEEELMGKMVTGVITNRPKKDYRTKYDEIIDRLAKGER